MHTSFVSRSEGGTTNGLYTEIWMDKLFVRQVLMSEALPKHFKRKNEILNGDKKQTINIVNLEPTYICFDVEQLTNAKQEVKLRRCKDIQDNIAWRMRTNVPTRYLINPSRGFIKDGEPITLTVELIKNKFHPKHKLTLQAMVVIDGCNNRTIWKHENRNKIQSIRLKLSTVLIHIDTAKYEEENLSTRAENFKSLMEHSPTTGLERIQELEKLLNMLEEDFNNIRKNTERATRLKAVLEHVLDSRKLTLLKLKRQAMDSDQKMKKLRKELKDKEAKLQLIKQMEANSFDHSACQIS